MFLFTTPRLWRPTGGRTPIVGRSVGTKTSPPTPRPSAALRFMNMYSHICGAQVHIHDTKTVASDGRSYTDRRSVFNDENIPSHSSSFGGTPSGLPRASNVFPVDAGEPSVRTTTSATSSRVMRPEDRSPWTRRIPCSPPASSLRPTGRTIEYGRPLSRTAFSPWSFHVKIPPSLSLSCTIGMRFSAERSPIANRFGLITAAVLTNTKEGGLESVDLSLYALMLEKSAEKGPGAKLGLANLLNSKRESMRPKELMLEGLRARVSSYTTMFFSQRRNSLKGIRTSAHWSATVSNAA
mmetsp:Transcript_5056/g.7848  ORF Transcript_5056/g.7848 Transcript_5056/m.7848 type:complete len:295 (-) Transcript_5056:861-1745(-)